MTIQLYINSLISEGLSISKVRMTGYYQLSGSEIAASAGPVAVEKFSYEDETLCEFFDQSGNVVARAKGFESVI